MNGNRLSDGCQVHIESVLVWSSASSVEADATTTERWPCQWIRLALNRRDEMVCHVTRASLKGCRNTRATPLVLSCPPECKKVAPSTVRKSLSRRRASVRPAIAMLYFSSSATVSCVEKGNQHDKSDRPLLPSRMSDLAYIACRLIQSSGDKRSQTCSQNNKLM